MKVEEIILILSTKNNIEMIYAIESSHHELSPSIVTNAI